MHGETVKIRKCILKQIAFLIYAQNQINTIISAAKPICDTTLLDIKELLMIFTIFYETVVLWYGTADVLL
jgi:hypothetical protein